jgi:hypothetical protein
LQERDTRRGKPLGEALAVDHVVAADHLDARAHQQRQVQVEHRHVAGDRVCGADDGVRVQARLVGHGTQEVHHRAVRQRDALRPAGGAGRVDDVGQIVRPGADGRRGRRARRRLRPVPVEAENGGVDAGQPRGQPFLGQYDRHGRVGEDVAHPFGGERRVDGHVGGAGPQHSEQRRFQFERTLQEQPDQVAPAHAHRPQLVRHLVGARVEFGIGQRRAAAAHRDPVGELGDPGPEQPGERQVRYRRLRAVTPRLQECPFVAGQFGQGRQAGVGVRGHGGEQHPVVGEHPVDRGGVEQVGVVLGDHPVAAAGTVGRERDGEVELRAARRHVHCGHVEAGQVGDRAREMRVHEHDREQRAARQVTVRAQPLDQALERHLGVGVRVQARVADACQRFGHGRVAGQVGAQHEVVGEVTDQRVEFGQRPAADRGAHRDVVLAGVAGEQDGERGERGHERRGVATAREAFEAGDQFAREAGGAHRPVIGLRGRAGTVGGQVEAGQVGELPAPVFDLLRLLWTVEPRTLPGGEVAVLHRQRPRPRRLTTRGAGRADRAGSAGIALGQLADEDLQRKPVADGVVHDDEQRVVVGPEGRDGGAQQRRPGQVERAPGLLGGPRGQRRTVLVHCGQIGGGARDGGGRFDHLDGFAVDGDEAGAQRLVPGGEAVQRAA